MEIDSRREAWIEKEKQSTSSTLPKKKEKKRCRSTNYKFSSIQLTLTNKFIPRFLPYLIKRITNSVPRKKIRKTTIIELHPLSLSTTSKHERNNRLRITASPGTPSLRYIHTYIYKITQLFPPYIASVYTRPWINMICLCANVITYPCTLARCGAS